MVGTERAPTAIRTVLSRCGSHDVALVLYRDPAIDTDLGAAIETGRIRLWAPTGTPW